MTLAEAQDLLDAAKAAYTKALRAKSATMGDHTRVNHDIKALADEIARWERTVSELSRLAAGSSRPGVRIARWT